MSPQQLVPPTVEVHTSFLAGMAEDGKRQDSTSLGRAPLEERIDWETQDGFAEYVARLHADALEATPRPVGHVPGTTYWYVDGHEYLGRLSLRHRLTPDLTAIGGHVGFDVRPSARKRGYATAMLRDVLPHAADRGLTQVLVTCDVPNIGSRKVIEANGGVLEDQVGTVLRFWVPTTSEPS